MTLRGIEFKRLIVYRFAGLLNNITVKPPLEESQIYYRTVTSSNLDDILSTREKGFHEINQKTWGGRQHYLRFTNPITWQGWEDAGVDYDSTLGFPDTIGFRCSTCHEFHVFNIERKKKLHLRERPLVCMDVSLGNIDDSRTYSTGLVERVVNVEDLCKRFDATSVLLWHNDHLIASAQRRLYCDIVESVI